VFNLNTQHSTFHFFLYGIAALHLVPLAMTPLYVIASGEGTERSGNI
jgi:hypothetical protein